MRETGRISRAVHFIHDVLSPTSRWSLRVSDGEVRAAAHTKLRRSVLLEKTT